LKVVERCPGRGHRVGYRDVIVCGKRHGGGRWTWSYRSRPLHLGRLLYNGRSGETGDTAAGEHAGHEHADDEPQERYDKYAVMGCSRCGAWQEDGPTIGAIGRGHADGCQRLP